MAVPTQKKKPVRRVRPEPPRRTAPPARRRGPLPGNRRRHVPWWGVVLVALACGGVLWLVLGQGDPPDPAPGGETGSALDGGKPGDAGTHDEVPENVASVASPFARPATGERLQLRVLSLGDDPRQCEAVSLRVGGEVRTAYHHRCDGRDPELAFFLVRLTGLAADPVTVDRTGFELLTEEGRSLAPLELRDVVRRFPAKIALGPDVSRKGWVVFELSGVPASLRYVDADQVLVVRFPSTWL